MTNVFRMQMSVIWNRKSTLLLYLLMCGLVVLNFISNAKIYAGYNVWNMYHPMRLVVLGDYSFLSFAIMQYFPFLVVIPAAFAFFNDRNCREHIIIETKTNRKAYHCGTIAAIFVTTFLIFTVPLLGEMIINCIAFPVEALGDQSNISLFENEQIIELYLFSELWNFNPYVYTFLMIVLFGCVTGVLACFASVCSLVFDIRFRVLIFVPVYVLLYVVMMLEDVFKLDFSTNYFFYLRLFCSKICNEVFYIGFVVAVFLLTNVVLVVRMRKDELG